MRHRVTGSKLGRTASHRRATLSALSTSLIQHKRIRTTLAKAKATQRTIEPIITRAKLAYKNETGTETKDIHARRTVARFIKDPAMVRELFDEIAPKVVDRNGGYTRVVKLGQRDGDGAHMAIIELVDYNETVTKKAKQKKKSEKTATVPPVKKKKGEKKADQQAEKVKEDVTAEESTELSEEKESDTPEISEQPDDTGEEEKRDGEEKEEK